MKSKKTKDDCTELKNIKYQNMLLSNSKVTEDIVENINNIEQFLTNEKKQNKNKPWNKIGKTKKIKIINEFVKTYSKTKKLNKIKTTALKNFLLNCIERKKLQKIKDVNYNKEKEVINDIPPERGMLFLWSFFTPSGLSTQLKDLNIFLNAKFARKEKKSTTPRR